MREIMRFAHDHLGVDELIARYAKENVGSSHVLNKLGFAYDHDIDYMADEGTTLYEGVLCRCSLKSMTL